MKKGSKINERESDPLSISLNPLHSPFLFLTIVLLFSLSDLPFHSAISELLKSLDRKKSVTLDNLSVQSS